MVLTMRSSTLKNYPGHAALPGGKADTLAETPFQIARREAHEEIGLPSDDGTFSPPFRLEHLCELQFNLAVTQLAVRPCVAFLHTDNDAVGGAYNINHGMIPRLDAKEVAAVFTAPFHNFLTKEDEFPDGEPSVGDASDWYSGSWVEWHQDKKRFRMHNFHVPITNQIVTKPQRGDQKATADQLDGLTRYRVFGMTARILVEAARIAYAQEPEFEHNRHIGDERLIERLLNEGRLDEVRKDGDRPAQDSIARTAKL